MDPMADWQTAYLQQLQRTTGRVATLERRGSRYYIIDGSVTSGITANRKQELIEATERLKLRPDWYRRK